MFAPELPATFPWHCKIKENLAVWSQGRWQYFNVLAVEGVPTSSVNIVNAGAVVANTTDALAELTTFDVNNFEMLQLRFEPMEDIEVQLWEARAQARFTTRTLQARVSLMTKSHDPYLATSEFNVLGRDRNAFIATVNNGDYAIAQSRVHFWGWKYRLVPLRGIMEQPDHTGVTRPYLDVAPPGQPSLAGPPLITAYCIAEGLGTGG